MKTIYEFDLQVDIGAVLPPVADVERNINKTMKEIGMEETLVVRGSIGTLEVATDKPVVSSDAMTKAAESIEEQFAKEQPTWKLKANLVRVREEP